MSPEVSARRRLGPLLGAATARVQVGCSAANKSPGDSVSTAVQNREPDHWFMIPARLKSQQGPDGAKPPWVCRNILARRLSGARPGAWALRTDKGPGAADLKFLLHKRDARPGTSIEKRHENPRFTGALCFPKFVQWGAETYYEL